MGIDNDVPDISAFDVINIYKAPLRCRDSFSAIIYPLIKP